MKTFIIIAIFVLIVYAVYASDKANKKKRYDDAMLKNQMGRMFQLLESVYLLEHTVKYDILITRYDFLQTISIQLSSFRNDPNYMQCAQMALKEYKSKYYDHIISQLQNDLLNNPAIIQENNFLPQQQVAFFMRYCDRMENEMQSLKTKAAKERRIEKINDTADFINSTLNTTESESYRQDISDCLKQVRNDYNKPK